ncbi:MAG: hypothetical protein GY722_04695, partial [bacterium]|nr:hypothetical protein [bacterium]
MVRRKEQPWWRRDSTELVVAEDELVDVLPEPRTAADVDIEPHGTRLGELLLARGTIQRDQLIEAILRQNGDGTKLGSILVEARALAEDELTEVLAGQA